MKDLKEVIKILACILLLVWLISPLFIFWGGNPKGYYWQVQDLKVQLKKEIPKEINYIIIPIKDDKIWGNAGIFKGGYQNEEVNDVFSDIGIEPNPADLRR